ncbi:Rieske (2Fe-2S) protein [Nocardioides dongxiaopingii]|uniref:Rieske (2Fe-2S) protein n=1 Tax=Nocardioides TaxID=1839 RepID=UPI0010C76820|nr:MULTISPECIES: Rieske (2Fe-2S) protein [Nocardioides]QCW50632.1 Rieske (2Fe-2S) protein [Nocardioides sp. S-1144]
MSAPLASRRIVFQGLGALGVAAALAACGGGDDGGGSGSASEAPETGASLAATSEVPVGGGIILADQKLVITQPTEGTFKAFTSVCTHQGSPLDGVSEAGITCPLHGSVFSIADGSPESGPATQPLAEVQVRVEDGQLVAA